jgi:uncharacterized membrane protein YedE/YeeE
MVPALLIFGNKHFGISNSFRHLCAACIPSKNPFFNYDWKKESWMLVLALGMIAGGFASNNYLTKNEKLKLSVASQVMFDDWELFYGQSLEVHDVHENGDEGVYRTRDERKIMPNEIFSFHSFSSPMGWIFIVLGGFLVGFGTRWANGCTSGHAIMGLSLLNPGSLVAVIGFFIGGLTVSWFIIPQLL